MRALKIGAIITACLLAVAFAVGASYPLRYQAAIYPGVTVDGVEVGGLTLAEAATRLQAELPDPAEQGVTLVAGAQRFRLSWAEAGQGYDYAATAQAAFDAGREESGLAGSLAAWRVRFDGVDVAPRGIDADPARVGAILTQHADVVFVPPTEASLDITGGAVRAMSGQPGQALDVEASLAPVLAALAEGADEVALVLIPLPPTLAEPEPARSQAQALLAQPFTLIVDDPLVDDFYAEFTAAPEVMATWLRITPRTAPEPQLFVQGDGAAIRAWLEGLGPEQLGEARFLDLPETSNNILLALEEGTHQARARVRHPARTYVVQPGDFFFDIAYNFGFPQYQLERVNPDVNSGAIDVGMVLNIPTIDVLFPHPLVPNKRIEIDLPTQTLYAYEGQEVVMEMRISSGMSTTPTIAGQFQILFKEENAYAQRWRLDMPYFMGIYEEGPGYYNGIHELPITAGGYRLSASVLGWPASFACIIVGVGDAEALFEWADVGTLVRIHGVAPGTPTWQETLDRIVEPYVPPAGEP